MSPWLRLALLLWAVTAVAVSVRTVLRPTDHTVFPIFAGSCQRWWADEPLYSLTFEHEEGPRGPSSAPDHFRYPPVFAIAFTPFDALGPRAGGILWGLVCLGGFGLGLWCYARDVLPEARQEARLGGFLVLALFGALRGLWNGQSNALAVGLLLLAGSCLARRRWWACAGLLGAAIGLKLTPLAPALLLAALWPRHLIGRLLVVLLLLGLLPFLTRPPETVLGQYQLWFAHLGASGQERWPGFRDAYTIYQAIRESLWGAGRPFPFKEPLAGPGYHAVQMLAAGAALAWCLWQARRLRGRAKQPQLAHLALCMGCVWLMLFGPSVEHATYAFLAPFLAWALVCHCGPADRVRRSLLLASGVCVLLLGWGALVRPLAEVLPLFLAALPVGTGLFLLWLLGHAAGTRITLPSRTGREF